MGVDAGPLPVLALRTLCIRASARQEGGPSGDGSLGLAEPTDHRDS